MSAQLLLVETSATMRHVLGEHLRTLGFEVQDVSSHREASRLLDERLQRFDDDYAGVVFGWPAVADADAEALAARLERDDVVDLPVLVMSTDMRAETRAWVAARAHTSMVAWKRFRDVDTVLEQLIDSGQDTGPAASKFDNHDICVLIVDDSATIRRSLRDLFSQQGYDTLLAADASEALELARTEPIDIAIVDFYLGDDTGDRVCRDLVADARTGDIVCAVLTGTYSDHIIRRSLRAGALECLFKNESSELLLNRVHALSRFVRQRRHLADERHRLDRVMNLVAGATLVLDKDDAIRNVSVEALAVLGHDRADALIGRPLNVIAGDVKIAEADQARPITFRRADGANTDVSVTRKSLGDGLGSVLQFTTSSAALHSAPSSARVVTPATAAPFLSLLSSVVDGREPVPDQVSLLVLRLWKRSEDSPNVAIDHYPDLEARLIPVLIGIYRRKDHVANLGDGRFGFLIRHLDEPQSWLLTRKIMQLANDALADQGEERLASTASLKRIGDDSVSGEQCLARALDGLEYVGARWSDKALLMDPQRVLSVYPDTKPAS